MIYILNFSMKAKQDINKLKKDNPVSYVKLTKLLEELQKHPETGTGKPERLKYNPLKWSRRIDKKNRLVYSIEHNIVTVNVLSALGHYGDK